jgi:hypothetical protein
MSWLTDFRERRSQPLLADVPQVESDFPDLPRDANEAAFAQHDDNPNHPSDFGNRFDDFDEIIADIIESGV